MQSDEAAIRQLVSDWMAATRAGDVERVLSLMTDDAVFLTPGGLMRKADFAAAARAQTQADAPSFEGSSEIQEIKIAGDWAYMWSKLTVVVTPPDGSPPLRRAGYTLTIFRNDNGRWRLARDANLLAPVC